MKRSLLLIAIASFFSFGNVTSAEAATLPGCPDRQAVRAEEKWAFLVYQVGPNRTVESVEVPNASDPAFQERVTKEAREGGVLAAMPGTFRSFRFEPPSGKQPLEPDRQRLRQALAGLSGPLTGETVSAAELAVRIEVGAGGQITGWDEVFATRPGLAAQLRERAEVFLTASGIREGETPRVVVLFFSVRDGQVVSASSSSYLLAC